MQISFREKNRDSILAAIKRAMGDRELGKIVQFTLRTGCLEVVISKLGTSTLTFTESETEVGLKYNLASEKIAFTHRALKDEVTRKIKQVVQSAGGEIA